MRKVLSIWIRFIKNCSSILNLWLILITLHTSGYGFSVLALAPADSFFFFLIISGAIFSGLGVFSWWIWWFYILRTEISLLDVDSMMEKNLEKHLPKRKPQLLLVLLDEDSMFCCWEVNLICNSFSKLLSVSVFSMELQLK